MTRERMNLPSELSKAIKNGNIDRVLSFLQMDSGLLHSVDRKSRTPLHLACKYHQMNIAKILIERHCDINSKNCWGHTPLHTLCNLGDVENCKVLVDAGADLSITDNAGYTPLDFALYHKHVDVAMMLIDAGAPVSVKGPNSGAGSPLHWACRHGAVDLIQLLIDRGADATAKNLWRRTPRDVCSSKEVKDMLDNALRGVDSVANFYSESKTPDDAELRNTFQQLAKAKENSTQNRADDDEINRFLRRNCQEMFSVKRAQEIASIAAKLELNTIHDFAKYLEGDRSKAHDPFTFADYEYLSLSKALLTKDLYSTQGRSYQVRDSDVFDIQPLRLTPDRNSSIVAGMFTAFTLQEGSLNEIIRRKVCIKTELPHHERDIVMEVKMFEECNQSLVAGIVEYLGCGMSPTGPYLIIEHFGISLDQYMTLFVPSLMARISLFTDICVAVCSIHAAGLMHGAITPEHILLTYSADSNDSLNFHEVKLCNLVCCRRIGDAFPVTASSELKRYPGYIAPEVYFGKVGLCRATTKIDAFTLSLIGFNLLCRKPSPLKQIFPPFDQVDNDELKKCMKDQERINEIILSDLDSPLSDIVLSICQLNPAERCDIETVVNMLQIRNSDIQSDLTSLMTLGDMYDELFSKLVKNVAAIKQFLIYDSGGFQIFQNFIQILRIITGNENDQTPEASSSNLPSSSRPPSPPRPPSQSPSPPVFELTEFHQHLSNFLGYLRKRGYSEDPLSPRHSFEEPEYPEEILLNKIIIIVDENQFNAQTSAIKEKLKSLFLQLDGVDQEIKIQRPIVCLYGDSIGRLLNQSTPKSLTKYYQIIRTTSDIWMDSVTSDQCQDLQNNILKMTASLHAVKNINRGLVYFMSNELSNLQKSYMDLVKKCYPIPNYCILLPYLSFTNQGSEEGGHGPPSIVWKKHHYRLQFLCNHTHQLIPSNILRNDIDIVLKLDSLSRECVNPLILTCLSLMRKALKSNSTFQHSLIPGLLPPEMPFPDPALQLHYLDCAYHLLHSNSIYSSIFNEENVTEDEYVNLGPFFSVPPLDSSTYPPVILTPDIAKFAYQKLSNLIKQQAPFVDLSSGCVGVRLVTSEKKKFGWIIDSDDIETRYLRS